MAWFDRNDAKVPEELRDAKQEDLIDAMKFYKANKDRVPQLEGELNTTKQTLSNVENEFTQTKARVAALESQAKQPPAAPSKAETTTQTEFFDDPDKALFERVKPLADFSLQQGAILAQMRLENHLASNPGKYGDNVKLYTKFQKEIEEMMKRETLINQSNPQAWFNAFTFIKGLHQEDIQEARVSGNKEFFGETATKSAPGERPTDVITEDDKIMAKKYGLDPQKLVDARKGFTYEEEGPKAVHQ